MHIFLFTILICPYINTILFMITFLFNDTFFSKGTLTMMMGSEKLQAQEEVAKKKRSADDGRKAQQAIDKAAADAQVELLMQQGASRRKGGKRMSHV